MFKLQRSRARKEVIDLNLIISALILLEIINQLVKIDFSMRAILYLKPRLYSVKL